MSTSLVRAKEYFIVTKLRPVDKMMKENARMLNPCDEVVSLLAGSCFLLRLVFDLVKRVFFVSCLSAKYYFRCASHCMNSASNHFSYRALQTPLRILFSVSCVKTT